ncbi:MAG: hypothetical protein RLY21_273 [Planctomycetota bacterium]|jgi:hypothetical protein
MNRYSQKFVRHFLSILLSGPAVLAVSSSLSADIQRREVAPEVSLSLGLATGKDERCAVSAWSGVGLEGSCGSYRWEQLKAGSAFAVLKSVVGAKDAGAARDALAVILSLPDSGKVSSLAIDWARRQGVDAAGVESARKEAEALTKARADLEREALAARAARTSPESAVFSTTAWTAPAVPQFDDLSARAIEAARALLARAGGSATLHESAHIAVLAESDDASFVRETAALEAVFGEWSERLSAAGVPVSAQARIPVIFVSDRDRWRQLVTTAFGGDPDKHTESVTIYPPVGAPNAVATAIVLVAPEGDRSRARYAATAGLARAILHYTDAPARGPAFLNEALPRVMADVSTPKAGMDIALRRDGLLAVRAGASFMPVVASTYADPMWSDDPRRARALSYLFVRWLWDNEPNRLLRFAKASGAWGAPGAPSLEARFTNSFGMSLEAADARARKWFTTND